MLVTLLLANGLKLANHNKSTDVQFISSLELRGLSLKSGLAENTASISIPKQALAQINKLIYLTNNYSVKIYVYIDNTFTLVMDGVVRRVAYSRNKNVTLAVVSKSSLYLKQHFLPKIENICQLQVYSEFCTLEANDFSVHFGSVELNTLTGTIPYTLTATQFTLGNTTVDISTKPQFKDRKNIELAFVRLDNLYRSRILSITPTDLVLDLNYTEDTVLVDIDIILSCDKTYGGCYKKFGNTKNFYGFSSVGKPSKTYNIFTSEALIYCGDFEPPKKECTSDNYLLGIEL